MTLSPLPHCAQRILTQSCSQTAFVRIISELLEASSHAVKYEAATTLAALTQTAAAIKATASALIELVVKESDNNVKLIVLDRLDALRKRHGHVIDPLVMDVLRVLNSTDMDVRRKALRIALDMVSSRNVEEVVLFLQKELSKSTSAAAATSAGSTDRAAADNKQLLIQSIHQCAIKFSEVASSVVHVLIDYLGDNSNSTAVDVIAFVREVVERFPDLRSSILDKLLATFDQIKSGKVFRGALWIVGEYATEPSDVLAALDRIRSVLGEIPILAAEERALQADDTPSGDAATDLPAQPPAPKPKVRADGTYATETAFDAAATTRSEARGASKPPLRALILVGDYYTATVLASTLVKLVLRHAQVFDGGDDGGARLNALRAEAMLIMTSILRVGQSPVAAAPIDEDSLERIMTCIQTLAGLPANAATAEGRAADADVEDVYLDETKSAFARMEQHQVAKKAEAEARQSPTKEVKTQPEDLIAFRQFARKGAEDIEVEDLEKELGVATGVADGAKDDFISKLQRVVQLTGFSDAVYAEAYVQVHQFDILLDVLVVNQTQDTLQNLTIEFATLGDLSLVDRPGSYTLGPYNYQSIKAAIKVASTETGVIFGNITYESSTPAGARASAGRGKAGAAAPPEGGLVVMNDIHIDILDYIKPSYCDETAFRAMWTEFEWENKVNVNTVIPSLRAYLAHVMRSTNMACLTPEASLAGDCGFLSANLYARSLFGEDALANVSMEQLDDGHIQGHVRIRSKTQGIALSLGDKITMAQKAAAE